MLYIESRFQAADILTKAFTKGPVWDDVRSLVGIANAKPFKPVPLRSFPLKNLAVIAMLTESFCRRYCEVDFPHLMQTTSKSIPPPPPKATRATFDGG